MTGLRLPGWLWAVLLFALALVPRAFALGHSVTPDEPNWVYRTLNFGAALARGDWAGSVQAGHPGVTTMWLGSLGLAAQRTVDPARAEDAIAWLLKLDRLSPENVEAFKRIGVLLDWARLPVIVVNALGVAGVYLLARRIFGQRVALLAAGLLALDPFAAGLGGLLHVDGLLMTFSALSLLALLNGLSSATPNHSAFCIPHSAFCILHSAFRIPHSAFRIP
ncbi:MAG TPA: glycosyltransferase family 39 protein [Anaerolineae bacterium]